MIKIKLMHCIHISDTHGKHKQIPWTFDPANADMIIHSGDFTMIGGKSEAESFFDWFTSLPIKYKILIAGNHDKCFDSKFWYTGGQLSDRYKVDLDAHIWTKELLDKFKATEGCFYLHDEAVTVEGINFYGSPYSKWFHGDYWAFNVLPGIDSTKLYSFIPDNTDVLITHGPCFEKLDLTATNHRTGSEELAERIKEIKPKFHLFGHIHEEYGKVSDEHTTYLNSSILNLQYFAVNSPQVFEV